MSDRPQDPRDRDGARYQRAVYGAPPPPRGGHPGGPPSFVCIVCGHARATTKADVGRVCAPCEKTMREAIVGFGEGVIRFLRRTVAFELGERAHAAMIEIANLSADQASERSPAKRLELRTRYFTARTAFDDALGKLMLIAITDDRHYAVTTLIEQELQERKKDL